MLETYFVKPQTVDRIGGSWIGAEIECGFRSNPITRFAPI